MRELPNNMVLYQRTTAIPLDLSDRGRLHLDA
jgi:hypothetical protein